MPLAAYRVCRAAWASLDGEGASKVGGRWNSPGHPIVYMAQSVALAVLENLVHMSRQDYPTGYVVIGVTIPDHIRILNHTLFLDMRAPKKEQETEAGDSWLARSESAVLRVPSSVVAGDWNYLLNPKHADFQQIQVSPPVVMIFDERLFVPSSSV